MRPRRSGLIFGCVVKGMFAMGRKSLRSSDVQFNKSNRTHLITGEMLQPVRSSYSSHQLRVGFSFGGLKLFLSVTARPASSFMEWFESASVACSSCNNKQNHKSFEFVIKFAVIIIADYFFPHHTRSYKSLTCVSVYRTWVCSEVNC